MYDEDDYYDAIDRAATNSEAVAEYARNAGADHPDRAWLLHDWDVWVSNPHYRGPPVPHPESDDEEEPPPPTERPVNFQVELDDYIPF